MMRWKGGFGGEVANREFVPDLLVSLRSRPRDDSLRENSPSRVGSDGMCSQGGFNYCLDSKIVPVEGLEILLKGQWQWRFARFRRLRIGDSPQMHDYRQLLHDFRPLRVGVAPPMHDYRPRRVGVASHSQREESCLFEVELAANRSILNSGQLAFIGTYCSGLSSLLLSYKFFVCWDGACCTDSAPPLPKVEYAIDETKELEDRQI